MADLEHVLLQGFCFSFTKELGNLLALTTEKIKEKNKNPLQIPFNHLPFQHLATVHILGTAEGTCLALIQGVEFLGGILAHA